MSNARQKVSDADAFWPEVLHRAKMLLSDMNVGNFYQWRNTVGDTEIKRLLKLMELLVSPGSDKLETKFLIEMLNSRLNGHALFSCFKTSGKKMIKEGIKGDQYCMPVLYVLIRYLVDDESIVVLSKFEIQVEQEKRSKQTYKFNPSKICHTIGNKKKHI
ncbi:TPA: hypothetical protein GND40_003668 [Salmonella enterica subsp. indica]|uniref:Uncharacterized protein n=5 Tax=Salmonella enterica TaxID=28901 RepID=A0A5Y2QHP4_SALER|nr:hypothetical protein [Salmonella enterica]EBH9039126.1 hypothetical protein [Salmonella enterica subsp. indica serovar 11:b:e,n,x]EBP3213345.1 hypothetical protein [Salmonella enterica subsp. arizonae]ECI8274112.1 hypothetical protein [Salmonella enterica subsp. enterica]EDR2773556.1 hypothetical protein [Salmonella enterica subsp. enterica serovar Oslo]EEM2503381.1 hypothetical protein [Salmonella enterica subsp. indica serovar 45:a:e,n,x]ESE86393.1 hypothetical protein SEI61121_06481 [Sa